MKIFPFFLPLVCLAALLGGCASGDGSDKSATGENTQAIPKLALASQDALTSCAAGEAGLQRLIDCTSADYQSAKDEMGRAYARALQELRRYDAAMEQSLRESTGSPPDAAATMIGAQEAWVRYRDEHCHLEALAYFQGREAPIVAATCLRDLTQSRTRQLRQIWDGGLLLAN